MREREETKGIKKREGFVARACVCVLQILPNGGAVVNVG